MAEGGGGGGGSTGPNLHALGLLDGKSAAEELKVNEDEVFAVVTEGMNKLDGTVAKLAQMIPLIGQFLSSIIPIGLGKNSALSGLSSEGFAGKTINPGKGGTSGGVLANTLAPIIAKGGKITPIGDPTSGSASGGGESGGGGGAMAQGGFGDMAAPTNQFEWSQMAMASLGALPRPITPEMGEMRGRDEGMSMG